MELRQCRYFIAVVDARSISAAARQLYVVQSAVSHQIARLEQELGTPLLQRSRSGVVPTEAGKILYLHAQAALKHAQAAQQAIRALEHEVAGAVAIGLPSSTAAVLAVPLLVEVRRRLPRLELRVIEGLGNVLAEDLARGRLDLSILFDDEPQRGFRRLPLFKERLHFASTLTEVRRAIGSAPALPLSEVARFPLVLPAQGNSVRSLLDRECAQRGLALRVIAELSGIKTILDAVQAGVASSVVMAANAEPLAGRKDAVLVPIRAPVLERTASLFEAEHFSLTPAAAGVRAAVLDLVRRRLSEGAWAGARLA
jgi:LysR family transcriptional regulator, nitrogen assimilation regulatory protein